MQGPAPEGPSPRTRAGTATAVPCGQEQSQKPLLGKGWKEAASKEWSCQEMGQRRTVG